MVGSASHRQRFGSDPTLGTKPLTSSFQGMPLCSLRPILKESLGAVAHGFGVLSVALAVHHTLTPHLYPAWVRHFPGSQAWQLPVSKR